MDEKRLSKVFTATAIMVIFAVVQGITINSILPAGTPWYYFCGLYLIMAIADVVAFKFMWKWL